MLNLMITVVTQTFSVLQTFETGCHTLHLFVFLLFYVNLYMNNLSLTSPACLSLCKGEQGQRHPGPAGSGQTGCLQG